MRVKIEQLREQMYELEKYISRADESWNDEVKESFFSRHVGVIRQNFSTQIGNMEQITSEFERTEREIESLM